MTDKCLGGAELGGKGVLGKRSKGCDLYIVPLCFLWGPFRQPPGCGRDPGTRAGPQFWDEPWHPGERLQLQDGRRQRRLHHEPFNRASTLASAAPGAGWRPGMHIRKQLGKELPGFLARALVEASRKKVHELDSLERSTRIAEHRACGLSSSLSGGPGYGLCLEIANNPRIPCMWFWFVPTAPSGPGKATRQRGCDQMGARWGYVSSLWVGPRVEDLSVISLGTCRVLTADTKIPFSNLQWLSLLGKLCHSSLLHGFLKFYIWFTQEKKKEDSLIIGAFRGGGNRCSLEWFQIPMHSYASKCPSQTRCCATEGRFSSVKENVPLCWCQLLFYTLRPSQCLSSWHFLGQTCSLGLPKEALAARSRCRRAS